MSALLGHTSFSSVDSYIDADMERQHKSTETLLRTWTVPAVFRLMYSSGMRTNEV